MPVTLRLQHAHGDTVKYVIATADCTVAVPIQHVACVTIARAEPKSRSFNLVVTYDANSPYERSEFTLPEDQARRHLQGITRALEQAWGPSVVPVTGAMVTHPTKHDLEAVAPSITVEELRAMGYEPTA